MNHSQALLTLGSLNWKSFTNTKVLKNITTDSTSKVIPRAGALPSALCICATFELLSYFACERMEDLRPMGQRGVSVAPQGPPKHMHRVESLLLAQKFYKIKSLNFNVPRFTERI